VLLQIKLSSYFKLSIDLITISVRVGDCFIRIRDCSIRVFRSFWKLRKGGNRCPLSSPGYYSYCIVSILVYVLNSAYAAARNGFNVYCGIS